MDSAGHRCVARLRRVCRRGFCRYRSRKFLLFALGRVARERMWVGLAEGPSFARAFAGRRPALRPGTLTGGRRRVRQHGRRRWLIDLRSQAELGAHVLTAGRDGFAIGGFAGGGRGAVPSRTVFLTPLTESPSSALRRPPSWHVAADLGRPRPSHRSADPAAVLGAPRRWISSAGWAGRQCGGGSAWTNVRA